jgi:hypothetical protein
MSKREHKTQVGGLLRRERGGAMVEFAILMLVFVPLVLLPLYFQDAMRYKLEAQEAVFSTAWDFAYGDYEKRTIDSIAGGVESENKKIFENLWSGNKKPKTDPGGPWADFNWINKETPISCSGDTGFMAPSGVALLASSFHSQYTKGGLVSCQGGLKVKNHYIPQLFMQDFALKDHFLKKGKELTYSDDPTNEKEGYRFGVMVDPWTLQDPSNVQEDGSGNQPFYERVRYVWMLAPSSLATYANFLSSWVGFVTGSKLIQQGPEMPFILKLTSLHLSNKEKQVWTAYGPGNYPTTEFLDGSGNKHKQAFQNRKGNYLGCKSLQPNCD